MSLLKFSTFCTGIGSPEQAINELGVPHEVTFGCEINKFAQASYLANFTPKLMLEDMTKYDYVGDEYYSDINVAGLPCQAFSLAGLRKGENDSRGVLFYDYYRWVKRQLPKAFVIENVKGLLSDANGKTFQNWLHLLGQSVNGHHQMFNSPDSLPYNLHWTVLNTKDFGVPQNRERVFLVGIRDDIPNTFRFPAIEPLKLRLKDILETVVDEKYYLSDKTVTTLTNHAERSKENGLGFGWNPTDGNVVANTLGTHGSQIQANSNFVKVDKVGFINQDTQASQVYNPNGISPAICAGTHGVAMGYVKQNEVLVSRERRTAEAKAERRETGSNSFRGKELVFEPSEVMNCLQTGLTNYHLIVGGQPTLNQVGDLYENGADAGRIYDSEGIARTIKSEGGGGGAKTGLYMVDNKRIDRYEETENSIRGVRADGSGCQEEGVLNTLSTSHKPKVIVKDEFIVGGLQEHQTPRKDGISPALTSAMGMGGGQIPIHNYGHRIRRLTPLECWRLQGFPDANFYKAQAAPMSDSQLYKQAGNSMTTNVIKGVLRNILKCIFETA